jgi:hypothetical protein
MTSSHRVVVEDHQDHHPTTVLVQEEEGHRHRKGNIFLRLITEDKTSDITADKIIFFCLFFSFFT